MTGRLAARFCKGSFLFVLAALPVVAGDSSWIIQANSADLNGILARHHLALKSVIRNNVFGVSAAPTISSQSLAREFSSDTAVNSYETDDTVQGAETPEDAKLKTSLAQLTTALTDRSVITFFGATVRNAYVNQMASAMVRIPEALQRYGPGGATVAVIDTGVDPTHPALRNVLVPGYDFTRDLAGTASELADLSQSTVAILDQSTVAILDSKINPLILNQSTVAILDQSTVAILDAKHLPSDFGHGTMVAGLIHLVAPHARIMPLKAFRANGTSNVSDVLKAIYYAVDHQAKVINMSFSMNSGSPGLAAAVLYARLHGVICIASAGNDGQKETVYPGAYPGVIGVGSVNYSDIRSAFSNYDAPSADTSAPGEALVTTYPGNNYAGVWGTSFSSALVSGTVAIIEQLRPTLSLSKVADAIDHGKKIDQDMGAARLDVVSVVNYALTN
jgi:subtilisin family serine protease